MIKETVRGRMNNGDVAVCICDYCGKEFRVRYSNAKKLKHHFDNKDCYLKFIRENKAELEITCENCGKRFNIRKTEFRRNNRHFCNQKCYREYKIKKGGLVKREVLQKGCKKCSICGEIKPLSKFNRDKQSRTGYRGECKVCHSKRCNNYHKKNKETVLKRRKRFYEEHKKRLAMENKKWRDNNTEYIREYHKKRMKNPIHRLNNHIGASMRLALSGNNKSGKHWEDIVGYTLKDLIEHLEAQFEPGMTWDNRGEWHIDHKKPISWFNFTSYEDEEFQQCWALDNLQPKWAEDNLSKGNRYIG
jgi:hypothetical protein